MRKTLNATFFRRPALVVARALLGKVLVRRLRGREIAGVVIETEAYDGFLDMASHAHRGRTARNAPMFAHGGRWYVYFTYGMHWMLNAVTGKEAYPAAILIRGAWPVDPKGLYGLAPIKGPARLTKAFGIDRRQDDRAMSKATGLWIEDRGIRVPKALIRRGPRIGVAYAGPWAAKPYRFSIDDPDFIAHHAHLPFGYRPALGRSRPARRRRL